MNNDDGLRAFRPDPRPTPSKGGTGKRKGRSGLRASPARWREIRDRKMGDCYVCRWRGEQQLEPSTLHHVVAKSLGGSDTEANLVPLCGSGTTAHHGDVEAHREAVCRDLAAAIQQYDDAVYAYAISKLGEDGFCRRYKVRFAA